MCPPPRSRHSQHSTRVMAWQGKASHIRLHKQAMKGGVRLCPRLMQVHSSCFNLSCTPEVRSLYCLSIPIQKPQIPHHPGHRPRQRRPSHRRRRFQAGRNVHGMAVVGCRCWAASSSRAGARIVAAAWVGAACPPSESEVAEKHSKSVDCRHALAAQRGYQAGGQERVKGCKGGTSAEEPAPREALPSVPGGRMAKLAKKLSDCCKIGKIAENCCEIACKVAMPQMVGAASFIHTLLACLGASVRT